MSRISQEDKLIKSCQLLTKKLQGRQVNYLRCNGVLHPALRKQLDSIIKQASRLTNPDE